jgi:RNA polymerase sigma-70 factor, ECF subfamily
LYLKAPRYTPAFNPLLLAATIHITEASLVQMLKNKEQSAFSYLYDNYSGALYGVVLRVLNGNELAAQDTLQEVFVKIWRNIEKYDASKGTLFTWMLNIARNAAIDHIRSNASRKEISNDFNDVDIANVADEDVSFDAIGIKDKVKQLNPIYQEVIETLYFAGLTQEEAAEKLGLPLGTVKTRIRTALIQLRTILKE